MVLVSMVLIFIVKFGFYYRRKKKIDLLIVSLFLMSSMYTCKGAAVLIGDNVIFNDSSLSSTLAVTNSNGFKENFNQSSQVNLWTISAATSTSSGETDDSLYIIRNSLGDTFFDIDQSWFSCSFEKCMRRSSGTATVALDLNGITDGRKLFFDRHGSFNDKLCYCRCLQNTPVFREDLHVCVNDIHECALVSFLSGNIEQKIPYVFLPLRGQIVHPNAEIKFNGINSIPTCIISRIRYLCRSGWYDIKNYTINEHNHESSTPFRLFHDKRRTFLQWLGNTDLRSNMEGRLILIDLICKDMGSQLIFTPCISFRVAGVPSSSSFSSNDVQDHNSNFEKEKKFSSNEYMALGLAILLIALIYVASVFLYLNFKKKKMKEKSLRRNKAFEQFIDMEDNVSHLFSDSNCQSKQLIVEEEGLVKNNPLLMKRYHSPITSNKSPLAGENSRFNILHGHNINSVDKIEVCTPVSGKIPSSSEHFRMTGNTNHTNGSFESLDQRWTLFRNRLTTPFECRNDLITTSFQKQTQLETNNIEEKHPDENISIVECPEDVIQTNSKHKLYFNPAYLELELLMAPPPAAIEFLMKIREIMTTAKRKIATKKFLPSLTKIPEESQSCEEQIENSETNAGLRCHKPEKVDASYIACEEIPSINPAYQYDEKEKRQIIQKWLQGIPTSQTTEKTCTIAKLADIGRQDLKELNENKIKKKIICQNIQREIVAKVTEKNIQAVPVCDSKIKNGNIILGILEQNKLYKELEETERLHDSNEKSELLLNVGTISNTGFNSSLPLDEELTMQNTIYNIVTGSTTLSKMKMRYENDPEYFSNLQSKCRLNDEHVENRYSLVSEVYVNDGFSSSGSSRNSNNNSSSSNSSIDSSFNSLSERVNEVDKGILSNEYHESSHLMIKLEDCPLFYSMENTDDFEPDTLDRKLDKNEKDCSFAAYNTFVDSLERPAICLRTNGSFRNDSTLGSRTNNLKRSFGSLQEIYQQRRKIEESNYLHVHPVYDHNDDGPHSLTSQVENFLSRKDRYSLRHLHRQRKSSPPPPIPNDVDNVCFIPKYAKPPLPPRKLDVYTNKSPKSNFESCFKLQNCRKSTFGSKDPKTCFNSSFWSYKLDDSGYLSSSDSDKSLSFKQPSKTLFSEINAERNTNSVNVLQITTNFRNTNLHNNDDDDDDDDDDEDDESMSSCNEGNSESGAESTTTNFKFYKNSGRIFNESS